MEYRTGGDIRVGDGREDTTTANLYEKELPERADSFRYIDTKAPGKFSGSTLVTDQGDVFHEQRKLFRTSLESCEHIYKISARLTDEDVSLMERENALATIVDLIYGNLKKFKEVREKEFLKLTMLFLQAIDYETIENMDREKAVAVRDALNIYRNGRISEQDIADVRRRLRQGGLDILRPVSGEF